jgi:hypothetical protein
MTTFEDLMREKYPVRLRVVKQFTRGILKGCINDYVHCFVSKQSADNWLSGVHANIAKKKLDYVITKYEYVEA